MLPVTLGFCYNFSCWRYFSVSRTGSLHRRCFDSLFCDNQNILDLSHVSKPCSVEASGLEQPPVARVVVRPVPVFRGERGRTRAPAVRLASALAPAHARQTPQPRQLVLPRTDADLWNLLQSS